MAPRAEVRGEGGTADGRGAGGASGRPSSDGRTQAVKVLEILGRTSHVERESE